MSDPIDRMTDEELARQAQNGSDQAAGRLIARYLPMAASFPRGARSKMFSGECLS